jgi:hypothetical protein
MPLRLKTIAEEPTSSKRKKKYEYHCIRTKRNIGLTYMITHKNQEGNPYIPKNYKKRMPNIDKEC